MGTSESMLKAIKKYNKATVKSYALKLNKNTEQDMISHVDNQGGFSKYIKSLIRKDMGELKKARLDTQTKASYTCRRESNGGFCDMENQKPIGVYTFSNTIGVAVYEIDYHEDNVLIGYWTNDKEVFERCPITEDSETLELGFMFGEFFVPFSQVIRCT